MFKIFMTQLGNYVVFRYPFHDSVQQHDCKGCGGKIHSSILCPKCPKVVDHEENLPKHTLVGIYCVVS